MALQQLHGSCACGRNRYVVSIPMEEVQLAEILCDSSSASRQHSASPLTLWLRVPLTWYQSATFAQLPDEERPSILRTFISPFASDTRRQFCGYCGTQLTSWHERTREDAEHIQLTVGSLLDDDQELLGRLGLLPSVDSSDEDAGVLDPMEGPSRQAQSQSQVHTHTKQVVTRSGPRARGAPWFEEMIADSRLGRFKQQRGGHTSHNGTVKVEWEIVEWTEGDDADDEGSSSSATKRKAGELEAGDAMEIRTV